MGGAVSCFLSDVPRCQIFTGLLLPPDVAELSWARFVQFSLLIRTRQQNSGVVLAGSCVNLGWGCELPLTAGLLPEPSSLMHYAGLRPSRACFVTNHGPCFAAPYKSCLSAEIGPVAPPMLKAGVVCGENSLMLCVG
ncbi:hypothetical protein Nepgr_033615 [Nepenthes gracilis]|uniref:Uncharacterized protein n=1 Tax=Nepenthes gracilis TaxID=150966 RepID=A0AAD3Y924_NEPGR|nr:hypothetical protein Nepgr_033615 [Nepenthes gracilis]